MKRNLIIGIGFLIVAVIVFYLYKTDKTFFKETSLYKAIPVSVPVFVELNSLKSIPYDSPVIERFFELDGMGEYNTWMHRLDSITKRNSNIQSGLRSDRFILAFGLMGDNELTPLLIQKAESSGRKKSIDHLIKVLFPETEFTYSEIDYAGNKIVSGTTIDNKSSINYCFTSGLLIASTNLVLVQQALLQVNENGILNNPSFTKLTESFNSEPDIAWFINQELFPDYLLEFINSNSISETDEFGRNVKRNHFRNVRDFKKFASWSELDARFNKNDILLKGLTVANDSTNDFLAVFKGQEPKRSKAEDILPGNTNFFTSYSFTNKSLFFNNLENYFSHAGSFYKREDVIRRMESNLRINFKETFQRMVKSEMIVAITDIPEEKDNKTTYFIFDVNGQTKTENVLDSVLNNYVNRNNLNLNELKTDFILSPEKSYTLIEFPYPSFPSIWLGKPFYTAKAKYAVFYKDFLVFCNSSEGLQNYLATMEEGNSLADEAGFSRVKSTLNSKSNIYNYINAEGGINLMAELLNTGVNKKLKKNKNVLQQIEAIAWQFGAEKEVFTNELSLVFKVDDDEQEMDEVGQGANQNINNKGNTNVAWKCKIGNQLIIKPVLTINHRDKTKREIVVQDKSNKLHQISSEGNINWSFDVGEAILSEIFQVDHLTNGKLQYLFSTKSKLFMVDSNGKNVEGFPVNFPAEAAAGVNVFDYDNNRQYRNFVPCKDKRIYAYNKKGQIIKGWTFKETESEVSTPVQHFRVKGKDYILFKDKQTVYIQNRRGEDIAKPDIQFDNSENPMILNPVKNTEILATDERGKIFAISFDGSTREINVGKFDDDHYFTAADLNGDNSLEFVFVDGRELIVINENGSVLFSKKFKGTIQHQPNIYNFGSGKKKIGVVDSRTNQIHLLDVNGENHEGFPMTGATEFSIGRIRKGSKQLNLIVGTKDGILVNYKLD